MNHDPLQHLRQSGQQPEPESTFNQEWNKLKSQIDQANAETKLLEEKLKETQLLRDQLLKGTELQISLVH